jgi:2-oxoglutarate ferredoxin oxidoreductase subunit beta
MSSIQDFSGYPPTWCPGCGNWGIGAAIKTALTQLDLTPSSIFAVFGIGCSGNMNDFLNVNAIHALHGRAIPNAVGMKLANHRMPVLAIVGDGDCYGEGGNHFIHACRGNHDITVIVHDNCVYGLTTGQVAPTAQKGFKSKSTPSGIIEIPVAPLALAIISGASFVAQGFTGDINQLAELIKKGISHKGFSLINALQPCVTFNKINTYKYYKERTYVLSNDYDSNDIHQALKISLEPSLINKFPLGIVYQTERAVFTDSLKQLKEKILIEKERFVNYDELLGYFV